MQLKDISGIGDKTLVALERAGITTPHDLLHHYPRAYRTYRATLAREAQIGEWVAFVGTISPPISKHTSRLTTQMAEFRDRSGSLTLRWFNMPYITRSLSPACTYLVRGQLTVFGNTRQVVAPQITRVNAGYEAQDELLAIYTPLGILKSGNLRKIIASTLKISPTIPDPLPQEIRTKYNLLAMFTALSLIHRPPDLAGLELAIHRLAFDELYALQLESLEQSELSKVKTNPLNCDTVALWHWLNHLPFTPTTAQKRAIGEILADLKQPIAMHRLLAGEVGSGKTLVAGAAALATHLSRKRTLVMAPTQILAEQLYRSLTELLSPHATVSLITAAQKGDPQADIVVGTQALLSPKHQFESVGLVIIDEQHRFGVKQRQYLSRFTPPPHVLTMTATPIPRTLAMTIFADQDISRLDELPQNRLPLKTYLVGEEKRDRAYDWIKKEITTNHNQAFVVVPLIEEGEDETGNAKKSLKLLESTLKTRYPGLVIDIIHGKMKEAEKTQHLQSFRDGHTQILVATSMVEVGIDIPGANIMVIEDAERFGLATLHQLRGRVGRDTKQGYCLLFVGEGASARPKIHDRLAYFVSEHSGAKLAAYDLEHRGAGELYGLAQHGFFSLRFASLADERLLQETHEAARYKK